MTDRKKSKYSSKKSKSSSKSSKSKGSKPSSRHTTKVQARRIKVKQERKTIDFLELSKTQRSCDTCQRELHGEYFSAVCPLTAVGFDMCHQCHSEGRMSYSAFSSITWLYIRVDKDRKSLIDLVKGMTEAGQCEDEEEEEEADDHHARPTHAVPNRPHYPHGTKKPVVYFRQNSNKPITLNVHLSMAGREREADEQLLAVYPPFSTCQRDPKRGGTWQVTLSKRGQELEVGKRRRLPYLFWDSVGKAGEMEGAKLADATFAVDGAEAKDNDTEATESLEAVAKITGMNARESTDFVTYWLPEVIKSQPCVVRVSLKQLDAIASLHVDTDDRDTTITVRRVHIQIVPDGAGGAMGSEWQNELRKAVAAAPRLGESTVDVLEWGGSVL